MELQFQSETCRCLKAVAREVRNAEMTQEVRLSDAMPDVGRVLTSRGQIVIRSKEWQGDLVTVSGGIMVWILYVPEDGTPVRCVDTWVPFQLKWELQEPGAEGAVRIYPLLRFVDARSISARKMMVRAGIAAMGEALSSMQAQVFIPAQLPDDIELLRNTYPVRLSKEAGEKTFLLDEELQLPAGLQNPERLLSYSIHPQLQEMRVSGDKLVLRGTGKLCVLYRCPEGKIHAAEMEISISQFAQLEDTYANDASADVMLCVTSLELTQNEGPQLRVKCGLVAQYLISDRLLAEITEDAYSPKRDIKLHKEDLELPSVLEQRTELIQAQQQIPGISGDMVDVHFLPDFPRQTRTGDYMSLELPGQFQLLYYAPDGSLQGTNARWENSMQIAADPDSRIHFLVQPYGNVQVISGADELGLRAQLKMEMHVLAQADLPMVAGLDAGEMTDADAERPSMIICRCDGESLWNMAKRCGSTVDDIIRINRLDGQPHPGKIIMIPISS